MAWSKEWSLAKGRFTERVNSQWSLTRGRFTEWSLAKGKFTEWSLARGKFTEWCLARGIFTEWSLARGKFTEWSLARGKFTEWSLARSNFTELKGTYCKDGCWPQKNWRMCCCFWELFYLQALYKYDSNISIGIYATDEFGGVEFDLLETWPCWSAVHQ